MRFINAMVVPAVLGISTTTLVGCEAKKRRKASNAQIMSVVPDISYPDNGKLQPEQISKTDGFPESLTSQPISERGISNIGSLGESLRELVSQSNHASEVVLASLILDSDEDGSRVEKEMVRIKQDFVLSIDKLVAGRQGFEEAGRIKKTVVDDMDESIRLLAVLMNAKREVDGMDRKFGESPEEQLDAIYQETESLVGPAISAIKDRGGALSELSEKLISRMQESYRAAKFSDKSGGDLQRVEMEIQEIMQSTMENFGSATDRHAEQEELEAILRSGKEGIRTLIASVDHEEVRKMGEEAIEFLDSMISEGMPDGDLEALRLELSQIVDEEISHAAEKVGHISEEDIRISATTRVEQVVRDMMEHASDQDRAQLEIVYLDEKARLYQRLDSIFFKIRLVDGAIGEFGLILESFDGRKSNDLYVASLYQQLERIRDAWMTRAKGESAHAIIIASFEEASGRLENLVKRTDAIWKIGEDAYARISALISTGEAPVGVDHAASQALREIDAIAQGESRAGWTAVVDWIKNTREKAISGGLGEKDDNAIAEKIKQELVLLMEGAHNQWEQLLSQAADVSVMALETVAFENAYRLAEVDREINGIDNLSLRSEILSMKETVESELQLAYHDVLARQRQAVLDELDRSLKAIVSRMTNGGERGLSGQVDEAGRVALSRLSDAAGTSKDATVKEVEKMTSEVKRICEFFDQKTNSLNRLIDNFDRVSSKFVAAFEQKRFSLEQAEQMAREYQTFASNTRAEVNKLMTDDAESRAVISHLSATDSAVVGAINRHIETIRAQSSLDERLQSIQASAGKSMDEIFESLTGFQTEDFQAKKEALEAIALQAVQHVRGIIDQLLEGGDNQTLLNRETSRIKNALDAQLERIEKFRLSSDSIWREGENALAAIAQNPNDVSIIDQTVARIQTLMQGDIPRPGWMELIELLKSSQVRRQDVAVLDQAANAIREIVSSMQQLASSGLPLSELSEMKRAAQARIDEIVTPLLQGDPRSREAILRLRDEAIAFIANLGATTTTAENQAEDIVRGAHEGFQSIIDQIINHGHLELSGEKLDQVRNLALSKLVPPLDPAAIQEAKQIIESTHQQATRIAQDFSARTTQLLSMIQQTDQQLSDYFEKNAGYIVDEVGGQIIDSHIADVKEQMKTLITQWDPNGEYPYWQSLPGQLDQIQARAHAHLLEVVAFGEKRKIARAQIAQQSDALVNQLMSASSSESAGLIENFKSSMETVAQDAQVQDFLDEKLTFAQAVAEARRLPQSGKNRLDLLYLMYPESKLALSRAS